MWALRHLREFCNTPEEHHAVCCGWFFPVVLWWPISQYQVGQAADLLRNEPWYVAFGTFLRALTFIGVYVGLKLLGVF